MDSLYQLSFITSDHYFNGDHSGRIPGVRFLVDRPLDCDIILDLCFFVLIHTPGMADNEDLRAMQWPFKDPKYIFFTDFDGTITLNDSNDWLVRSLLFP